MLRHVVTEPHPSALDDRSHSLPTTSYHLLSPQTHFPPPPFGTGLARLKPRRRQLTNADHGPSFTDTNKISPLFTRRHPLAPFRFPPMLRRCTAAASSSSLSLFSSVALSLLFALFSWPPRGISHPTDRPAVRPLPARDYCPSTRNQLTDHPVHAPFSSPSPPPPACFYAHLKRRRSTPSLARLRSPLLSFSVISPWGNRAL